MKIAHWADKFLIDALGNYTVYSYIVKTTNSRKKMKMIPNLVEIQKWMIWPESAKQIDQFECLYLNKFVLQTLLWKVG